MRKSERSLKALLIVAILVIVQFVGIKSAFAEENIDEGEVTTGNTESQAPQIKSIKDLTKKISTYVHTYTGKKRTPSVKLWDEGKKLVKGTDFTVSYKNNKETGRAQIIVTGKGNYNGTIKEYFYIAPKKSKIETVESSSDFKKATITWKKDDKATGYTIYMSTKKDGEYKSIKTIKNKKTVSYTKSGLKKKGEYYFKVRAYKLVKATGKKVYSKKYSKAKMRGNLIANIKLTAHGSGANRNYNLKKASNTIRGTILKPGQTFNWFRVVGPASGSRGYKMASIFKNGQVSKGYGGGVCQVSSTLYQAARKAGLEIIERHIHSRPVTYTKLGNDATVSYGVQNLIFRNNKNYSIKIVTSAEGQSTMCKLYSVSD